MATSAHNRLLETHFWPASSRTVLATAAAGAAAGRLRAGQRPASPPAVLQATPCSKASSAVSMVPAGHGNPQWHLDSGSMACCGEGHKSLARRRLSCRGRGCNNTPRIGWQQQCWQQPHLEQPHVWTRTCNLSKRAVYERLCARHFPEANAPHALAVCSSVALGGGAHACDKLWCEF